VLYTIDVAKWNPFAECYVFSPDTDVFLPLILYCEYLPLVTYFVLEEEQMNGTSTLLSSVLRDLVPNVQQPC
jgi:hypothetical protein